MRCPRCQHENPGGQTFCGACGTPLTANPSGPPAPSYGELTSGLSEALEREQTTGAILRVIASSPTTVEPVFDAILDSALRLCASPVGNLHLFDGETFRLAAHRGMADGFVETVRGPHRLGPHTGPARAVTERRPIHILDMMADRAYEERDPIRVKAVELLGTRTALFVPMLKEGTPIGVLVIWRREVRAYSESQIQPLSTFADQAVIAIENVRLFQALEARNARAGGVAGATDRDQRDSAGDLELADCPFSRCSKPSPSSAVRCATRPSAACGDWKGASFISSLQHNFTPEGLAAFQARVSAASESGHHGRPRDPPERRVFHTADTERDPDVTPPPSVKCHVRSASGVLW